MHDFYTLKYTRLQRDQFRVREISFSTYYFVEFLNYNTFPMNLFPFKSFRLEFRYKINWKIKRYALEALEC